MTWDDKAHGHVCSSVVWIGRGRVFLFLGDFKEEFDSIGDDYSPAEARKLAGLLTDAAERLEKGT